MDLFGSTSAPTAMADIHAPRAEADRSAFSAASWAQQDLPPITGFVRVDDPHNSSHVPGTINVKVVTTTSSPVPSITTTAQLWRVNPWPLPPVPIGVGLPGEAFNATECEAFSSTICVPGQYYGTGIGVIIAPPGYIPPVTGAANTGNTRQIFC